MKIVTFASIGAVILAVTSASADPITERKDNMKERGALMRVLAPIAQGQQAFDAATVMDALQKLNENAQAAADIDALWPAGSESGDTKSGPRIWSDRAAFQAAADKFVADTAAAVAANPQDLPSFQAVFGPAAGNCGACHEAFRL